MGLISYHAFADKRTAQEFEHYLNPGLVRHLQKIVYGNQYALHPKGEWPAGHASVRPVIIEIFNPSLFQNYLKSTSRDCH